MAARADGYRICETFDDAQGDAGRALRAGDIAGQHRELITTKARHQVAVAHGAQ